MDTRGHAVEFVDVFSSQGQLLADQSAFGYGRKSLAA